MKRIAHLGMAIVLAISVSSCKTGSGIQQQEELAGYTLKCKKELMQQKILNKKNKTVISTP